MAFSLPFGHQISGDTLPYRLDARLKLLILVCYIASLFLVDTWLGIFICFALFVAVVFWAKLPLLNIIKAILPIWPILVFTLVFNTIVLYDPTLNPTLNPALNPDASLGLQILPNVNLNYPQMTPLVFGLSFSPAGLTKGIFFVLRIALLIMSTSLLTYTTSIVALADAISTLLSPLKRIKVPVDDFATMVSIALRFIPITSEEVNRIMMSQKARGVAFDSGSLKMRLKAWGNVLIPVFVSLFRKADDLAEAMESRCYTGVGRTRLRESKLRTLPVAASLMSAIAIVTFALLL